MIRSVILLFFLFNISSASHYCAWFVGKVRCPYEGRLNQTIIEVWDEDYEMLFNKDDLAGVTVISEADEGYFKVEGCASDMDYLIISNPPEFFLAIKHYCKGKLELLKVYPPDEQVFAPFVNDHFLHHPIYLG